MMWTRPSGFEEDSPGYKLSGLARLLGWIGVLIGAVITLGLAAICTFNEGALDSELVECLFPITLAVMPHATAFLGLKRQEWGLFLLTLAGVITILFGIFAFLLAAMLPAPFYFAAAVAGERPAGAPQRARNLR